MKKILAILLSLSLLATGAALADTTVTTNGGTAKTTVTYTVGQKAEFIVTIPSGITLNGNGASGATGQMTVSLDASDFNISGQGVTVRLTSSANQFKLVNSAGESVRYTVSLNGTALKAEDTVLNWTCTPGGEKTASAALDLEAAYVPGLAAGDYTDSLTFTVSTTGR